METINKYQETIDLFGKKREVTITIKTEPDPDAISVLEEDAVYNIENYEKGAFTVDIIIVEVKCNLFRGIDTLGGCIECYQQGHLETVDYYNMVNEAIDDYRTNAKRYKDFFEGNK